MSTKSLLKSSQMMPTIFNDFFSPWNAWFDDDRFLGRTLTVPAVNVTETKDEYKVSLAAPGMKKEDFYIDVNGSMITISSNKEEKTEEKDANYTRKEYNYSSFSRSFTLPEEVNREKIDAHYEDGILKLSLPKKEETRKLTSSKQIAVK